MAKETIPIPEAVLFSSQNQSSATIEMKEPSSQPNETASRIKDKAALHAEAVIAEALRVTKEQIPEQKPSKQPS